MKVLKYCILVFEVGFGVGTRITEEIAPKYHSRQALLGNISGTILVQSSKKADFYIFWVKICLENDFVF